MDPIAAITCFIDGEREDQLISAICRALPDIQISFRTSSPESLSNFLRHQHNLQMRTIVFHDQPLEVLSHSSVESNQILFVDVETLDLSRVEDLSQVVARLTREQSPTQVSTRALTRSSNLILVTGSAGAPGTTTVAANLIWEISRKTPVVAIDTNPKRNDLAFLLTGRGSAKNFRGGNGIEFLSRQSLSPVMIGAQERLMIMEIGAALSIATSRSDRRREGRDFMDSINQASFILFITQPDRSHISDFHSFCQEILDYRFPGVVIPVLNKFVERKEHRLIAKEISQDPCGSEIVTIARDNQSVDRSREKSLPLGISSPRSRARRAISALAETLLERHSALSVPSPRVTRPLANRRFDAF